MDEIVGPVGTEGIEGREGHTGGARFPNDFWLPTNQYIDDITDIFIYRRPPVLSDIIIGNKLKNIKEFINNGK